MVGGYIKSCQKTKKWKKKQSKPVHVCNSVYTDAHYLDSMFDGGNENQTSSPLAVASLIIFFSVGTLDLFRVSAAFLVLASFGEKR